MSSNQASTGIDRARFLRNIDAWHAELATVQFTCSDAEKRAIIVELVFKMLLVELASRKHANLVDSCVKSRRAKYVVYALVITECVIATHS